MYISLFGLSFVIVFNRNRKNSIKKLCTRRHFHWQLFVEMEKKKEQSKKQRIRAEGGRIKEKQTNSYVLDSLVLLYMVLLLVIVRYLLD